MVHQDRIGLSTTGHRDMHDITEQIAVIVRKSNVLNQRSFA
ncbi:MAG: hypothetical protein ACKVJX_17050 [Verrucomicrobiia bacterium]|jgi:thiamine phosphate synthase YjbQ (UPF0047 family)